MDNQEIITFPVRLTPRRYSPSPATPTLTSSLTRTKCVFEVYANEILSFYFRVFFFFPKQPFGWNAETTRLEYYFKNSLLHLHQHLGLVGFYILSVWYPSSLCTVLVLFLILDRSMSLSMCTLTLTIVTYAFLDICINVVLVLKSASFIQGFNQFLSSVSYVSRMPLYELSNSRYSTVAAKSCLPPSLHRLCRLLKSGLLQLIIIPVAATTFFIIEKAGPVHFFGDKLFVIIFGSLPNSVFEHVICFSSKIIATCAFLLDLTKSAGFLICIVVILIELYHQHFKYLATYDKVVSLNNGLLRKYRCVQIMHRNCELVLDELILIVVACLTVLMMEMVWVTIKGWSRLPLTIYWIAPVSVLSSYMCASLVLVGLSVANNESSRLLDKWRMICSWRPKYIRKQVAALDIIKFRCARYFGVTKWTQMKYFAVSTEWIVNTLLTF